MSEASSGGASTCPTPLRTQDGDRDYAVLLNGEPTKFAEGDWGRSGGTTVTHGALDGEQARVRVTYGEDGTSDVTVIVDGDLEIKMEPADPQPETGLEFHGGMMGIEATVRILPGTEVENDG